MFYRLQRIWLEITYQQCRPVTT